jgi:urease accessory protein UreE
VKSSGYELGTKHNPAYVVPPKFSDQPSHVEQELLPAYQDLQEFVQVPN